MAVPVFHRGANSGLYLWQRWGLSSQPWRENLARKDERLMDPAGLCGWTEAGKGA